MIKIHFLINFHLLPRQQVTIKRLHRSTRARALERQQTIAMLLLKGTLRQDALTLEMAMESASILHPQNARYLPQKQPMHALRLCSYSLTRCRTRCSR